MTKAAKQIEFLRLLKELQSHNEAPVDTILRALHALRHMPDDLVMDAKRYSDLAGQFGSELMIMQKALDKIASQKLPDELEADLDEHRGFVPDYEHGYEQIIKIARTALSLSPAER